MSEKSSDRFTPRVLLIGIIVSVVLVTGSYVFNFLGQSVSSDTSNWGEFGDYFGGILNPTFSLIAIWLIFLTYRAQKKEIKAMGKALEKQNTHREKELALNQLYNLIEMQNKRLETYHPLVGSMNSSLWQNDMSFDERVAVFEFTLLLNLLMKVKNIEPASPILEFYQARFFGSKISVLLLNKLGSQKENRNAGAIVTSFEGLVEEMPEA